MLIPRCHAFPTSATPRDRGPLALSPAPAGGRFIRPPAAVGTTFWRCTAPELAQPAEGTASRAQRSARRVRSEARLAASVRPIGCVQTGARRRRRCAPVRPGDPTVRWRPMAAKAAPRLAADPSSGPRRLGHTRMPSATGRMPRRRRRDRWSECNHVPGSHAARAPLRPSPRRQTAEGGSPTAMRSEERERRVPEEREARGRKRDVPNEAKRRWRADTAGVAPRRRSPSGCFAQPPTCVGTPDRAAVPLPAPERRTVTQCPGAASDVECPSGLGRTRVVGRGRSEATGETLDAVRLRPRGTRRPDSGSKLHSTTRNRPASILAGTTAPPPSATEVQTKSRARPLLPTCARTAPASGPTPDVLLRPRARRTARALETRVDRRSTRRDPPAAPPSPRAHPCRDHGGRSRAAHRAVEIGRSGAIEIPDTDPMEAFGSGRIVEARNVSMMCCAGVSAANGGYPTEGRASARSCCCTLGRDRRPGTACSVRRRASGLGRSDMFARCVAR